MRKKSLLNLFFCKHFFAFADKTISFRPHFFLTTRQVRRMFKVRSCFFFLILLVCIYFCLRDSWLEMSLPISSRFCDNFFLLQSKGFSFLQSLQHACWWYECPLSMEKVLVKLLDIPYIFFKYNTLLILVTASLFQC